MLHVRQFLHRAGIAVGLSLLALPVPRAAAAAASKTAGKAISGLCAGCHGANGIAVDSNYPNLAGENYHYLVKALDQFKTGQRPSSVMHGITAQLSAGQIDDLAAYYASLHDAYCAKR